MRIFILGLRRSGTTIFWESFRKDSRFVCYDEPFNPILNELPAPEPKGTRDEWIALFEKDPEKFWKLFAAINRIEELQEGFSARQRAYFDYVLASARDTVIDMTRCHFKVDALHAAAPDAFLIHLHRPAAAWVSSHLGARGRGLRGRIRTAVDRASFFERRDRYNYWGIEGIIADSPRSLFGRRLTEAGLDPDAVYAMPAIGRMLAFWKVFYDRIERDGPRLFGARFASIPFSDFCHDPSGTVRGIYERAGMSPLDIELGSVHAAHGAYCRGDPRWLRYARRLGFDESDGLLF